MAQRKKKLNEALKAFAKKGIMSLNDCGGDSGFVSLDTQVASKLGQESSREASGSRVACGTNE